MSLASPPSGSDRRTSSPSIDIDTPESPRDSFADGHDDGRDVLAELEEHGGYELQPIKTYRHRPLPANNGREGDDDDDEMDDEHADIDTLKSRRTSIQSFELYTPEEEKVVLRKLDVRLVLFVALLYMLSFLDRSNIGNAKVAGLMKDLHISDNQYEWLLTAFYITYIAFEWMTVCYKIFPPHAYISMCVLAWGILASLQSLVTNFAGMIVLRILLGIGEAAFVGIPIYLSFFFRRDELAFRTGLFISAAPLATSFASTLAWLIVKFGSKTGIASWRLLLLLEGFPACLVAVWAWFWLPDSPGSASWLSSRERCVAIHRLRREVPHTRRSTSSRVPEDVPRYKSKFRWSEVRQTLLDPTSYLTALMFFCCNVAFSSMPVFLPTIMNDMGFSRLASQGLSAPPFLVAFVVVLLTAVWSDRIKSRSLPLLLHAILATSGYIFLAVAGHFKAGFLWRYIAIFPVVFGFFSAVTIVITWTLNNQLSDEGKGAGIALNNFVGQMGPILGTRLYPDSDGPYFVKGMGVCAVAMAMVGVLAMILRIILQKRNRRKAMDMGEEESSGLVDGKRDGSAKETLFIL